MKKWEYKTTGLDGSSISAQLNRLGNDGWELVAVTPVINAQSVLIFKRPVPPEKDEFGRTPTE
jgi:hypothetical protein